MCRQGSVGVCTAPPQTYPTQCGATGVTEVALPSADSGPAAAHIILQDGSGLSTIYDYVYDVAGARWTPWVQLVPRWSYPTPGARVALSKTVVPTLDSTRYGYLMKLVHAAGKPVLVSPGLGGPSEYHTS